MMTDQVTTVETSKRLLELGVPAGKASMVWCQNVLSFADGIDYEAAKKAGAEVIPAFTVYDLLEIVEEPEQTNFYITKWGNDYSVELDGFYPWFFRSRRLIDSVFQLVERLKMDEKSYKR